MTQVSDVYDEFVSIVSTQLSGYKQLPNPYSVEESSGKLLNKGFAVIFGPDENTRRLLGCKYTIDQSFIVIIVNKVTTTGHNTSSFETLQKNIQEDKIKLVKAIETDADLNGTAANARYIGSGGIEPLEGRREIYISIAAEFRCEFFDDLT